MNDITTRQPWLDDRTSSSAADLFDASLLGQYIRIIMLGTLSIAATFWVCRFGLQPLSGLLALACLLALFALTTERFAGHLRLAIFIVLIGAIGAFVGIRGDWYGPLPFLSPAMVLLSLAVLSYREVLFIFPRAEKHVSFRSIAIGVVLTAAAIYLIAVPLIENYLEQTRERPAVSEVQDMTVFEMIRNAIVYSIVFSIFAYFGACVGSFLNVVAESVPRGKAIAMRSSACPNCKTTISRRDNLPIFGYLLLKGRCRSCQVSIPLRYLVVELTTAGIFASLFVYELLTGAANVPGFRHYFHTGIVWIILYTKWPVVGIYLYHAMLFSFVLTLALMETDRLQPPKQMAGILILLFSTLAICIPVLQPVTFDDQTSLSISTSLSPWMARVATCLLGGIAGCAISLAITRLFSISAPTAALVLIGVTLGWQALATVTVCWILLLLAFKQIHPWRRPRWLGPATLLFVAAMLHHPFWKALAMLW